MVKDLDGLSVQIDKDKLDMVTDLSLKLVEKFKEYRFYIHAASCMLILTFVPRDMNPNGQAVKIDKVNMLKCNEYITFANNIIKGS